MRQRAMDEFHQKKFQGQHIKKIQIGNTPFDVLTFDQVADYAVALAKEHRFPASYIVTPNVDHVLRLANQPELKPIYEKADLSLADGMPVVWASQIAGEPLPERVTGADLLPELIRRAHVEGMSVFLMGGPPGSADLAMERFIDQFPGLKIETYCPPFGFEKDPLENQRLLREINDFCPDFLFVGLGSPKQEIWIYENRNRLKVGLCLGIGAAIEFAAGTLARAPYWMQKSGTEWMYRLAMDPKRLAKRYWGNMAFLGVLVDQLKKRKNIR